MKIPSVSFFMDLSFLKADVISLLGVCNGDFYAQCILGPCQFRYIISIVSIQVRV